MARSRARIVAEWLAAVLACLALGVLVRWPLSVFPAALAGDTNFPFHVLVARHLSQGGDPTWFTRESFPVGFPLAVVAVVPTLLAALLDHVTGPIVALNLALVANIALQAGMMVLLGADLGWSRPGRALAAVAAAVSPVVLQFSGGSQHENVAVGAFALACMAPRRRGWRALALGVLALLWAGFSSPYQAVPAGFLLLACSAVAGWRPLCWAVLAAFLAALPVTAYYSRIGPSSVQARQGMPTAGIEIPANLLDLVRPTDPRREEVTALRDLQERLRNVIAAPTPLVLGRQWPEAPLRDSSYLGLALLPLGLAGLFRGRREPLMWAVAAAGLLCLALALGSTLHLSRVRELSIPLPWQLVASLPLAGALSTTVRFSTGAAFALALGAGRLVAGTPGARAWWLAAGATAVLAVDGLLVAPVNWPLPGFRLQVPACAEALPPGPVAVWPHILVVSPHRFDTLAVVLDRPLAYYGALRLSAAGQTDTFAKLDFAPDEDPSEWLRQARAAGVRGWLRLEHPHGAAPHQIVSRKPWFAQVTERCEGGWCVGTFEDAAPAPAGDR